PLRDGHRLHTFDEVCEATTARLEVEIKDPAVMPLLARFLEDRPDVIARMRLTSFRAEALVQARELLPQIPRGMIVHRLPVEDKHPEGLDSLLERTGASALLCGWEGLTAEAVEAQHAAGRRVHGWPLRTAEQMTHALEIGVGGPTAGDPQAAVARAGQARAARGCPRPLREGRPFPSGAAPPALRRSARRAARRARSRGGCARRPPRWSIRPRGGPARRRRPGRRAAAGRSSPPTAAARRGR